MARSFRVTIAVAIFAISLFISISASLIFAQAINDPTAQSNIHASHIASNFASEIVPGINYTDPNTKKNYYLIGSINRGYGKAANVTTPIVANKTGTIPTAPTTVNKTTPIQAVTNINNTTSLTINIYHLSSVIIYDTKQIVSYNKTTPIQPILKGTKSVTPTADGGWEDTNLKGEHFVATPSPKTTDVWFVK